MVSVGPNSKRGQKTVTTSVSSMQVPVSRDKINIYQVCPTCRGKGYVLPTHAESMSSQIAVDDNTTESESEKVISYTDGLRKSYFHKESSLPIFQRATRTGSMMRRSIQSNISLGKLPINDDDRLANILPSPKKFDRPTEAARIAMGKLKSTQWDVLVEGLQDIVQLSRFHMLSLEPHFKSVNRALTQLVGNLRSHVARTACQACGEIFKNMPYVHRPEFDGMIAKLLVKTADMNHFIRKDANDALDKIVTYVNPVHSVRALVVCGSDHKSPLVRAATIRLLTCIALVHGTDVIYKHSPKEIRKLFFNTAAKFLSDADLDTRRFTGQLFKAVMVSDEFEDAFHSDVPKNIADRTETKLTMLKFAS